MRELDQIRREHREILNLFLSVIIIGFLLNACVSVLLVAGQTAIERYVWLVLVLILLATIMAVYLALRLAIVGPIRIDNEFATVLIYDTKNDGISIPLVMSKAREGPIEGLPVPFVMLASKVYRRLRNSGFQLVGDEVNERFRLLERLVEFVVIQWYRLNHPVTWAMGRYYRRVGPLLGFGWSPDKPSDTMLLSDLATRFGKDNPSLKLQYSDKADQIVLPKGMTLETGVSQKGDDRRRIVFKGDILTLTISVGCTGGAGGAWNLKTWNRRMTGDPDDLFAYGFIVAYEIELHEGLRRFVPDKVWTWRIVNRLAPKVTIEDVYGWAKRIVEGLEEYFGWYQEESEYVDSDWMELVEGVDDGRLVYRFREPYMGASEIVY
jgi:hypothetical protein